MAGQLVIPKRTNCEWPAILDLQSTLLLIAASPLVAPGTSSPCDSRRQPGQPSRSRRPDVFGHVKHFAQSNTLDQSRSPTYSDFWTAVRPRPPCRIASRMTSPSDRREACSGTQSGSADPTMGALQQRIRQQEILAELGVVALQGRPFLELLNETARLTAEGMNAEFCKVLEYIPADNRLLVRAGVGWHEGIVGKATVGADLESPSGFALRPVNQ